MITSRILIKPINLYLYIQFEVVVHREILKKKGDSRLAIIFLLKQLIRGKQIIMAYELIYILFFVRKNYITTNDYK